jgi:hypothetical protein
MMIVPRDFAARHASASELEPRDPGLAACEVDAPDAQSQGLESEWLQQQLIQLAQSASD